MRWERLFDDLEAQFDAAVFADFDAEVADRTRRERALVCLRDRLQGVLGGDVELAVDGGLSLAGTIVRLGEDWLLITDPRGRESVVVLSAIVLVRGLRPTSITPDGLASRLHLGHVLRQVARDRADVVVNLRSDVSVSATIEWVGADFIDVTEHAAGEPCRAGAAAKVVTVRFDAIASIERG